MAKALLMYAKKMEGYLNEVEPFILENVYDSSASSKQMIADFWLKIYNTKKNMEEHIEKTKKPMKAMKAMKAMKEMKKPMKALKGMKAMKAMKKPMKAMKAMNTTKAKKATI